MTTHQVVFLNGDFIPANEAVVPILDRGFMLGDGVYEVIPAFGGQLFRLPEHLKRLDRSLDAIRIPNPMSEADWQQVLKDLVTRNGGGDLSLYLQVTRGVASKRDHAFPDTVIPTVLAMCTPAPPVPDNTIEQIGVGAITRPDIRWDRCDIKAITLLANVLLRQEAHDAGAYECILIREGFAWEGAASNLFIVQNGVLITPPKGAWLLPGITRDLVLELADEHGFPYREDTISESMLADADEIWLTSSTRDILPVTRLNDQPVGDGKPGPRWRTMRGIFLAYKQSVRNSAAV
ncbi:MAG: D-amino acid aminotransferase [Gammaproteobacteria bacterium]|nr:MAG: D-amino acid aminotransferase [Gammaproteobacteria bacterium]